MGIIWETLASYKSVWITLEKETVNETPGETNIFGFDSWLEVGVIWLQIRVFIFTYTINKIA